MRLTGLGKFIILILAIGVAVGGWRLWQGQGGKGGTKPGGGFALPRISVPGNGGSNSNTAGGSPDDILLVTSASKKGWLQDQIERFNSTNTGKYRITTKFMETREAMHAVLEGSVKPTLWSPSSTIWTARLAQAWREKNGSPLLDLNDSGAYRVFFRTPLVFLTTREKAKFLRPVLGGSRPWETLRLLSLRQRKVPWGQIHFSHADPLNANSGMMTLGLIVADYSQLTGQEPADVVASTRFRTYMRELEHSLVYDLPAQGGSSALVKAFLQDPTRYDFITAYENAALDAIPRHPNLAVIYPNPTAVSEHVVALFNGEWVSQEQSEGARAFIRFLGSEESLRSGLKYNFRPAQAGDGTSLASTLARYRTQGFQQSFSAVELPPYEVLNNAAFQWRIHVAKKPA
jgi:Ca-activated chloride channel family protein